MKRKAVRERTPIERTVIGDNANKGWSFIVPNSNDWEVYWPPDDAAPYRAFAGWDGTNEGLRLLANDWGSLTNRTPNENPQDNAEPIAVVKGDVEGLSDL